MENKQQCINQMLGLIMESSHDMPDSVFRYFIEHNKNYKEKIVYNLIAESYLTLFSFCRLMFDNAWSQAFALLRVGLEQVAAVFVLANYDTAIDKYIELNDLKIKFTGIESKEEKNTFLTEHEIKKNKFNDYFDYSWVSPFTSDGKYGRNQLLELSHLEEFLVDIENSLNAFSHGSISVFQMNGDGWEVMKRYGRRASLTCCKLYDFLCCSLYKIIGNEAFSKMGIDNCFKEFKSIYNLYIEKC